MNNEYKITDNEYKITDYDILGVEHLSYEARKSIIEIHIRFIRTYSHKELAPRVFLNFEFDEIENSYFLKFHSVYCLDLIDFLLNCNALIIKNDKHYLNKHVLLKLL